MIRHTVVSSLSESYVSKLRAPLKLQNWYKGFQGGMMSKDLKSLSDACTPDCRSFSKKRILDKMKIKPTIVVIVLR